MCNEHEPPHPAILAPSRGCATLFERLRNTPATNDHLRMRNRRQQQLLFISIQPKVRWRERRKIKKPRQKDEKNMVWNRAQHPAMEVLTTTKEIKMHNIHAAPPLPYSAAHTSTRVFTKPINLLLTGASYTRTKNYIYFAL